MGLNLDPLHVELDSRTFLYIHVWREREREREREDLVPPP